jgi:serine/threonine protein kinase
MSEAARYRVQRKIASGGMAEIFLALQQGVEGFQKQVVLKRILPAYSSDPHFVRMLVDEAHIASTLNHGNLVQVLDLRHSGSEYFLVLEFVDGWSLEQVRRRAAKAKLKLPLPIALSVVGSLCRALAYVHTRTRDGQPLGIIHRDVTPQNVLVSVEGEVKLADFGIAKALGRREKSATGIIKGKFAYMSPEQAAGQSLDHRSDLFSVGTVLYLLTTGKKPFDGDTDLDVLAKVRKGRYEKPSSFMRDFNPEVERFIVRALRVNRETRFQTAEQMAEKIEAILAKLGQPTGPTALKRWLETLVARDGIQSPSQAPVEPAEAKGPDNPTQAVSGDIELESVTAEDGPQDRPTARERPERVPPSATEVDVGPPPTLVDPAQAARLAAATRLPPRGAPKGAPKPAPRRDAADTLGDLPALTLLGRFGRWSRKMAIRTAVVVAVVGGAGYFARPHLPAWLVRPVEGWLRSLPGRVAGAFESSKAP